MKSDRPDRWQDWVKWSERARFLTTRLQCCNCVRRGIYDCSCEQDDLNMWLQDVCYERKFDIPPVKPVNKNGALVMHPQGFIVGPYLGEDWKKYSYYLLEYFHDILEHKDIPDWSRLFFRDMNDFYAGSYGHFYDIYLLYSQKLPGLVTRHMALNDVSLGVDFFENLLPSEVLKTTNFRGKGEMHSIPAQHKLHLQHIHKMDELKEDTDKWIFDQHTKIVKRTVRLKTRVNKMKKFNRKNRKTMHYIPNKFQSFENWYPKIKQIPLFYDYKTHSFKIPEFETNPLLEKMHEAYISKTIAKWLKRGTVYMMDPSDEKNLVTPLVMANLPTVDGKLPDPTKKPRLCHDGGYEKELEGHPIPCKMEDLPMTLPSIEPEDLLTKLDDQSGFHQVPINFESRGLVVFKFKGIYFTYTVVPFGVPKSPAAYQRANSQQTAYGRFFGVRSSIYMDDRICMDSQNTIINGVPQNCFLTSLLCVAGGGFVSLDKSDFEPKTIQEFLGLQIDTSLCEISVPKLKWERFEEFLTNILRDIYVTFKDLEILRGKCVSFILTNPMTKLFIRYMTARLKEALKSPNWSNNLKIKIDKDLREELMEWLKFDHLKMKHCFHRDLNLTDTTYIVTFTDASSFALGISILTKPQIDHIVYLNEEEQAWPIHLKEALAILNMIRGFKHIFKAKELIHFCDNESVVKSYNGLGSKNEPLTALIIKIYRELKIINATLTLYWCSTTIQKADGPSRTINYSEEFIPSFLFEKYCKRFEIVPTVDCMATYANTKCSKFISWKPIKNANLNDQERIGCNFFAQKRADLSNETLYIFPPKRFNNKVAAHLGNYFMDVPFLFIFHAIGELPMSIANLVSKGAKLYELSDINVSIIPAEKRLEVNNKVFMGFWNTKSKSTYAIVNKI